MSFGAVADWAASAAPVGSDAAAAPAGPPAVAVSLSSVGFSA
ncbi:hypothetical protein [Streptomyces bungoensis]